MGLFKKTPKAPEVRSAAIVKVVKAPKKPRHIVEDWQDAQARCPHPATVQMGGPKSCLSCGADL